MIIIIECIIVVCIIITHIYLLERPIYTISNEEVLEKDIIEDLFVPMGNSYDEEQDIMYTRMDSWQREYGYCALYDKLAWILYMSIDCEPIYFEYNEKTWLIEFWKGQYSIATGCEIGIYVSDEIQVPSKNLFFNAVDDDDMIEMGFILKKDGKVLFKREDKHWWLTGFRIGQYSNPANLTMDISLSFKNNEMLIAFVKSLKKIGYREISIENKCVRFEYGKPKTKQSFYRKSVINYFIQMNNKHFCRKYNVIVKGLTNIGEKLELIRKHNIKIYIRIIKFILNREILYKRSKF